MVPQRKFKFGWEEIAQMEGKRADDLAQLQKTLNLGDLNKFTHGYIMIYHNELVFYITGISHPQNPYAKAPSLRIMK